MIGSYDVDLRIYGASAGVAVQALAYKRLSFILIGDPPIELALWPLQ